MGYCFSFLYAGFPCKQVSLCGDLNINSSMVFNFVTANVAKFPHITSKYVKVVRTSFVVSAIVYFSDTNYLSSGSKLQVDSVCNQIYALHCVNLVK